MRINNCQLTFSLVILMLTAPYLVEAQNDFLVLAPYNSPLRSTCGAGNDCSLRSTEEHIYKVNILNPGTWTFSLCGSSMDTWIHVGSSLCTNDIGNNDNFCSTQSEVTATITAGTYYVTIEASAGCGNYILDISGPPADSTLTFQKSFGEYSSDEGYDVVQTADGGYLLSGSTYSYGIYSGACLIKTDIEGNVEWNKAYGASTSGYDFARSVEQTADGGYVFGGETSLNFDYDYFMVRTDSVGDTLWTKVFGGIYNDFARDVCQTTDGGFAIVGEKQIGSIYGQRDAFLIRTDPTGDTLWTKTYGEGSSYGMAIRQTADLGFILTGKTYDYGPGLYSVYLLKTNSSGDTMWTKSYGGVNGDEANDVVQTRDGGYLVVGETKSFGAGGKDIYVLKTDGSGNLIWSNTYGGGLDDYGNSVKITPDGGFLISGSTSSFGTGSSDAYLLRIDQNGILLWSRVFGGTGPEEGFGALPCPDGGYLLQGFTQSFGAGDNDLYLIKTNSIGNAGICTENEAATIASPSATISMPTTTIVKKGSNMSNHPMAAISISMGMGDNSCEDIEEKKFQKLFGGGGTDHPYSVHQTKDDGYIISGETNSFGSGNSDFYVIKTDTIGTVEWSKNYGGSGGEFCYDSRQTSDGGYIHTGTNTSELLLIKTNGNGDTIWVRSYGGSQYWDVGYNVRQTNDGGYIVAGWTRSFGAGNYDMYVVKTDANGNLLWSKTYGGSQWDKALSIEQTTDNGYIILGETSSFGSGLKDIYVIRTDENGDSLWTRAFGGSADDYGYSVKQIADGNFLIVGYTSSFGQGGKDAYMIKIDVNGDIMWGKTYGYSNDDYAYDVIQGYDGGYVISGYRFNSGYEMVLIKTDELGDTVWVRAYEEARGGYSLEQTSDGGYVTACYTSPGSFGSSGSYFRMIKTDAMGYAGGCFQGGGGLLLTSPATIQVNPATLMGSAGTVLTGISPISIDPPTFESNLLITTDIVGTNISCNGGGDGTIDLIIYGGMGPYSFLWSSGQTSEDIVNVPIGTYNVIITDDNGCEALDTITLSEPSILTNSILGTNISCNGGNDGNAMVTAAGGVPPYNYFWSMGQITSTAIGLYSGTYTVNVTDNNGCPGTNIVTLTEPDPLSAIISATDATCIGGNGTADLSVSGGTLPYSYAWSNGEITEDITGIVEGTYHVTITDSCANMFVDSIYISEPPPIISSIIDVDVSCNGFGNGEVDLSVTGGTLPYSYLWSNTATTEDISSLAPNTYYVTITDGCGINVSDTIEISEPAILTTIISSTDVTCNGGGDGTATVIVSGGTSPYNYMWNTGQSTSTAVSLFPGNHSVNIFDANGCLASNSISISQPLALASSIVGTDVTCIAGSDGAVDLAVIGGTLPYTYAWSNTTNTEDLSNISSGTYIVTITDSCSFVLIDSIAIIEPPALISTIVVSDISCNGNDDGIADLSVSGGTTPYSYLWSNSATTEDIGSLDTGTYIVNITDACSAVLVDTAILTEPAVLTTTMTNTSVNCYGGGNGTATATPSGGTAPYNYLWNNGQVTATAVGLFPGNYTVNVTDVNGCLTSDIITITEPAALSIGLSIVDATCGEADGSAEATVAGGTAPYTYAWTNGGTSSTDTALAGGTYSLNVTDVHGCMDSVDVLIPISALVQEICIVTVDSSSTKNEVVWEKQTVSNIDSFRVYRNIAGIYTWVGSVDYSAESYYTDSTDGIDPNVTSYRYKLSVLDLCGNESELSDYHETMNLQLTYNGSTAQLSWDPYEGFDTSTFNYQIMRDTGSGVFDTIDVVTVNNTNYNNPNAPSGSIYLVEVIHPFGGCTADKIKNYNSSKSNTSSIGLTTNLSATTSSTDASFGGCDGTATVSVSGGLVPYTYLWDGSAGFQATATAVGLCAGNYYVTITDANGDTLVTSEMVNESSGTPLTATTSSTDANAGLCDGTATVTATGGTPPYTYQWDGNTGNQTGATATSLCSGTYSVTVIDSLGNQTMVFVTIGTIPGILEIVEGGNAILVYPNPYSGETQISYSLNEDAHVLIEVHNVLGEVIAVLANEKQRSGGHKYYFGAVGKGYANGVYFVELIVNGETYVKRIVELK